MGGGGFDDIITRHLNLPLSEAESRKSKTSVSALIKAYPAVAEAIQAGGDEDVKNLVVYETVNYLNDCLEEIDKVFKYYTSRQMDNSIDAVLLYGGTAAFSEILGYMTERLGIPVSRLDDISGVDFTQSKGDVALYANALGALIRI
jgi:type IV pilus assembly protein PilM